MSKSEPWTAEPSAKYVVHRLCLLASSVWKWIDGDGYGSANDCCCGEGGFWAGKTYDGTYANGYRNDGKAIMWLEEAANALAGVPDPEAQVKRWKAAEKLAELDAEYSMLSAIMLTDGNASRTRWRVVGELLVRARIDYKALRTPAPDAKEEGS